MGSGSTEVSLSGKLLCDNIIYCLRAMKQRQPAHFEQVAYSQKVKAFLGSFKVNFCPNPYQHHPDYCHDYHGDDDKRRNPYKEEEFGYYPSQTCSCTSENCRKCHNLFEFFYHPLVYKTSKCNNYGCRLCIYCYMLHENEAELISRYQFFRFDLATFKTEICPNRQPLSTPHQLASCHFYHNESDRRRNPNKISYSHVQCVKGYQCDDAKCEFAHNKIQQLYHPSRYKTKYCQSFVHKKTCQYNQYCSFAHSDQQIKIELLHEMSKDQYFYDFKYKTVWCPYTNQHDRANCPYAHNFQDYRRDPKKKYYTPEICPNWTKGQIKSIEDSGCPLRMECPKSHGWLEKKYHPDRRSWETGDTNKQTSRVKNNNEGSFVLGAPFFKQQDKPEKEARSQSGSKRRKANTRQKQQKTTKQIAWFNFSLLLPNNDDNFSTEETQNDTSRTQFEACWMFNSKIDRRAQSPHMKNRKVKKHKTEYTKSLEQLLIKAKLEETMSGIKINQIKLLSMSHQEIDKLGLTKDERIALINVIKDYQKSHQSEKLNYTDSMVKIFRNKQLTKTLQKLKHRKITQKVLQGLSSSSIDELSFLEEEEKSSLPKALEAYKDNRDYSELSSEIYNTNLISQETNENSNPSFNFKT